VRRAMLLALLCALFGGAGGYFWFRHAAEAAPTPDQMRVMMTSAVIKRDRRGGEAKCLLPLFVKASDVSAKFRKVLIETEDRSFERNWGGLNAAGLLDAVLHGGLHGGGSSITQQLVKNIMFEPGDNRWARKAYEIPWAVLVTRHFSADDILTAYLNHLPFRHGLYGIEAAALYYFNKHARDLNYYESALLEVMLSNPRTDWKSDLPNVRQQTERKAHNLVAHLIKQTRIPASARHEKVQPGSLEQPDMDCGYTRDFVMREAEHNGWLPSDGSTFRIFITLDSNRQLAASATANAIADALYARNGSQVSIVNLDPTGRILALQGGVDYRDSQFDRATDAKRSPGSLGKIVVLAEACEQHYTLDSDVPDRALLGGRPRNDDNRYLGKIKLLRAFVESRNAAFFRLAQDLGPDKLATRAEAFGLHGPFPKDGGLAVGDFAATPLEMTAVVATIANGGTRVQPYVIAGVTGPYGTRSHWRSQQKKPGRVLSEGCANMVAEAMGAVVKWGTGRNARIDEARGKTGTTNEFRDAWFVGYTKERNALGIWMGNDEQIGMNGIHGGSLPARAFRIYFQTLHAATRHHEWIARVPHALRTSELDLRR
jgi:penicillin-binding protein 1A